MPLQHNLLCERNGYLCNSMKIKYIVYAVLGVGLAFLVFHRIKENKKEQGGNSKRAGSDQPAPVNAVVVDSRDFSNAIAVTGSIDANEGVQIHPEVQGLIRAIGFEEGSNVSKGQMLIRIDDSELRAQLAQAVTKENLAKETQDRARQLYAKEAISREEHDQAVADYKSFHAQTELIRAQLAKTTIRAPFSGKIGLRSISMGDYVTPTSVIASLVNNNPIKITFTVPEKYASQIKNHTAITFTVAGSKNKNKASIYAIEPQIDANTRTLQIRARADNSSGTLIPGSFASVTLPLNMLRNAILIPTQAVVPVQDGKKVYVVKGGKASERMIETDTRTDSSVVVSTGLAKGDTVITTGLMTIKEGSPVKISLNKAS